MSKNNVPALHADGDLLNGPVERKPQTLSQLLETGAIDKYLYTFKQNGADVTDLSNDGINRLALSTGVSIRSCDIISEDEETITVQAVAVNADGLEHHGLVRENKRDRNGRPNPFALQNAASKAQRNAKKGLLPMAEVRHAVKQAGYAPVGDDQ